MELHILKFLTFMGELGGRPSDSNLEVLGSVLSWGTGVLVNTQEAVSLCRHD